MAKKGEILRPHPHQSPAHTMALSYFKGSQDWEQVEV